MTTYDSHPYDTSEPDDTLFMEDNDPTFTTDRLGADCHKLQFLRELTQNSIEAIQNRNREGWGPKGGTIIWDADWNLYEDEGSRVSKKLCVIDNGIGMTGGEILKNIKNLSASGQPKKDMQSNYGFGAKIAALTRNADGIRYQTWKHGVGTMAYLFLSPKSDRYGLMNLTPGEENKTHTLAILDEEKPVTRDSGRLLIDSFGTKVTLMGNQRGDSTMYPPDGVGPRSRWVTRYLNTRYFKFPEDIEVKAREGWDAPMDLTEGRTMNSFILRVLHGQKWFLDKYCKVSGIKKLSDADAYWWILKDKDTCDKMSGIYATAGHTAALYKDEIYDVSSGRRARSSLESFGVWLGEELVVIYIKPHDETKVMTDTSRGSLRVVPQVDGNSRADRRRVLDGDPLPWDRWSDEFKKDLPKPIAQYMRSILPPTEEVHADTIKKQLNTIAHLLKPKAYGLKARDNGKYKVVEGEGDDELTEGPGTNPSTGTGHGRGPDKKKRKKAISADISTARIVEAARAAASKNNTKGKDLQYPGVVWVNKYPESEDIFKDLYGRAARYLQEEDRVLVSSDFYAFVNMVNSNIDKEEKKRKKTLSNARRAKLKNVVKMWWAQGLVAAITAVKEMSTRDWAYEDEQKLLSDEALTTAALASQYHVNVVVGRGIHGELQRVLDEGLSEQTPSAVGKEA